MRGDPPLIGCACCADWGLSAIGDIAASERRVARASPLVRQAAPAAVAIIGRIVVRRARCRHRHPIASASVRAASPLLLAGLALAAGIALFPLVRESRTLAPAGRGEGARRPGPARSRLLLSRARRQRWPDSTSTSPGSSPPRRSCRCRFALADSAAAGDRRHRQGRSAHRRRRTLPAAGRGRRRNVGRAPATPTRAGAARRRPPEVLWTTGVASAEPVLIYNRDGYKPANWSDLDGETVAFVAGCGLRVRDRRRARRASGHPVGIARAAVGRRAHLPGVGRHRRLRDRRLARRLARPQHLPRLRCRVSGRRRSATSPGRCRRASPICGRNSTASSRRLRRDGTLARLADRYMPDPRQIQRIDAERAAGAHPHACCRSTGRCSTTRRRRAGSSGGCSPRSPTRNRNGIRRPPAPPACAGSCRSPRTRPSTSGSRDLLDPAQNVVARGALPARPQGQAARAHPRARPDVAGARRVQHRPRPPRGRAHPRAEAEARSGPVERREEGAAAARASRVLPAGEAGLCAGRDAGGVRRPRARVLRRAARARAAAPAASRHVRHDRRSRTRRVP